ncbi:hypothetical protein A8926_4253 [Saccharopolyspora spinosa]|uniref:Uncharacterized protein n=1 Tax=Saccharopolyspora spinosa TaxID=60894 RepID=A0A2N3Y0H3_SACSN|nr:hypothetical protein A8926_4253 [Saccharopolyspora spinosa]
MDIPGIPGISIVPPWPGMPPAVAGLVLMKPAPWTAGFRRWENLPDRRYGVAWHRQRRVRSARPPAGEPRPKSTVDNSSAEASVCSFAFCRWTCEQIEVVGGRVHDADLLDHLRLLAIRPPRLHVGRQPRVSCSDRRPRSPPTGGRAEHRGQLDPGAAERGRGSPLTPQRRGTGRGRRPGSRTRSRRRTRSSPCRRPRRPRGPVRSTAGAPCNVVRRPAGAVPTTRRRSRRRGIARPPARRRRPGGRGRSHGTARRGGPAATG